MIIILDKAHMSASNKTHYSIQNLDIIVFKECVRSNDDDEDEKRNEKEKKRRRY